jgi:hypothetical protein
MAKAAIITVFKRDLERKNQLLNDLESLCHRITSEKFFTMFFPKDEHRVEFLRLMVESEISFSIAFHPPILNAHEFARLKK